MYIYFSDNSMQLFAKKIAYLCLLVQFIVCILLSHAPVIDQYSKWQNMNGIYIRVKVASKTQPNDFVLYRRRNIYIK